MESFFEIKNAASTLKRLEQRRDFLTEKIRVTEKEHNELMYRYKQKQSGIDNLKKNSFSNFRLKLMNKYENRLDSEMRAEALFKDEYDRSAARLEALKSEMKTLGRKIPELRKIAERYDAEINRRQDMLMEENSPAGGKFRELNEARVRLASELCETSEALIAAQRAESTAAYVLRSLDKAEDWATYDIWMDTGIIGHSAKYSYVDSAESGFNSLRAQLKELRRELEDIGSSNRVKFTEISSSQRTMDLWFDNIFTDLSVRDKIRGNIYEVRSLQNKLKKVLKMLNEHMAAISYESGKIEGEIEELLDSM